MKRKLQRGQGLVEFALVIVVLIGLTLGVIDFAPLFGDFYMAKQMSARGARAASIYLPDGTRDCLSDAINAIGNPPLISADWNYAISANCDGNPLSTHAPGENVTVTISVDYTTPFSKKSLPFSVATTDQAR